MKKVWLLYGFFLLFINQSFAQKTYDIEFDNGTKKTVLFEYDDPEILPKWNVDVKILGLLIFVDEAFSFSITPTYRFSNKLMLDAHITLPYGKRADANAPKHNDASKACRDWRLMAHYTVKSKQKTKVKKVDVDYTGSEIYVAHIPRVTGKNLCVDAGIGNYRFYSGRMFEGDISNYRYSLLNISNTSLDLGLSYFKSESYKMNTDEIVRSYWRSSRLFAFASVGLSDKYEVQNSANTMVAEGFNIPFKTQIGYRIGYEINLGIKNSGNSMILGVEFGALAGVNYKPAVQSISLFHIGVGFGAKPEKLSADL